MYARPTSTERAGWLQVRIFHHRSHSSDQSIIGKDIRIQDPLGFAFVDYDKAFDSIEFSPLFESLENQGVEAAYTTLLRDLYNGATSTLKIHRDSDKIKLQRGVTQGDNISPKPFTAWLQDAIINEINWEKKEST